MNEHISSTPYNGAAARKRAEERSERSDMKQHADKLYQGFKKLNDTDTKRAIWELFQNAIDLSLNCEISIEQRDSTLIFCHNGELFNSDTLISLIKQVSSKSLVYNTEKLTR